MDSECRVIKIREKGGPEVLKIARKKLTALANDKIRIKVNYIGIAFGDKIQSDRKLKIYTVEKTLEKLAWEIFKHEQDHSFSYTDCTSFALMRRRKIREAFAFDEDFARFGWIVHPEHFL
jgi:predicted nucleic acid-binding protein